MRLAGDVGAALVSFFIGAAAFKPVVDDATGVSADVGNPAVGRALLRSGVARTVEFGSSGGVDCNCGRVDCVAGCGAIAATIGFAMTLGFNAIDVLPGLAEFLDAATAVVAAEGGVAIADGFVVTLDGGGVTAEGDGVSAGDGVVARLGDAATGVDEPGVVEFLFDTMALLIGAPPLVAETLPRFCPKLLENRMKSAEFTLLS